MQAACKTLKDNGFTEVVTYECLAKNLDVITANLPKAELGWGDEKVNLCMIFPLLVS